MGKDARLDRKNEYAGKDAVKNVNSENNPSVECP